MSAGNGTSGNGKAGGGKKNPHLKPPFAKGNPGGPGNPWAKMTANLRAAIVDGANSQADGVRTRAKALADELWEMALSPIAEADPKATAKRWAMQQILDRALGKPVQPIDLEAAVTFREALAGLRPELRSALAN